MTKCNRFDRALNGVAGKQVVADGIPKWLDKFFFTDILRKDYNLFKVVSFNIAPANIKGENYASVMLRVTMKVENNVDGLAEKTYVAKVNHQNAMSKEMMAAFNVFPKEIEMYTSIVPAFEKIYADVGANISFGPR